MSACTSTTTFTTAMVSAEAPMQRTKQINHLHPDIARQFTPRELRVQRVMQTEPWKLTRADLTENPAEYYLLTGSYTSAAWLKYSNRERKLHENLAWRMDEEWLRIYARRCWPPENRASLLRRVDRFVQHRIDWYVDAEEELAAWDDKVARIRGEYDEGYSACDDVVEETDTTKEAKLEVEVDAQAEAGLFRGEREKDDVMTQTRVDSGYSPYRASKFTECLCAGDKEAECAVRCGAPKEADLTRVKKSCRLDMTWKNNIFRRVKKAHFAYQIFRPNNWYADGR